jgi:hypothetical protein
MYSLLELMKNNKLINVKPLFIGVIKARRTPYFPKKKTFF